MWDLLILLLFWIAALSTRPAFSRWTAIAVWLLVALAASVLLYSAFTAFPGFEVNEGEYKVMGMAPYGEPIVTTPAQALNTFRRGDMELLVLGNVLVSAR